MKIAIFAAFPQELKPVLKNLTPKKRIVNSPFVLFFSTYSSFEILLVETGAGIYNGEEAFNYVVKEHNPDFVLSIGFGGALYEGAKIGDLIWASKVFLFPSFSSLNLLYPEDTFNRLNDKSIIQKGCFITLKKWMKKSEIEKILPQNIPFPVCEMETFPLAKLSLQKGLPFCAIRSITDTADEDIPFHPHEVTDSSGKYRFPKAIWLLLRKPKLIPKAVMLGRNSKIASYQLWLVVKSLIETL